MATNYTGARGGVDSTDQNPAAFVSGNDAPKTTEVFIINGEPSVTFVQRSEDNPQDQLLSCLELGGVLISVQGPSKCGKTTLCRKTLAEDDCIWLDGGAVKTEEQFWLQVISKLNVPIAKTVATREESITKKEFSLGIFRFLFDLFQIAPNAGMSKSTTSAEGTTDTHHGESRLLALDSIEKSGKRLVVDDFHLIPQSIHAEIVAALKAPIFRGLQCIFISIPERGFDPSTVVDDMTFRIEPVEFKPWGTKDLTEIARQGFSTLNVVPTEGAVRQFAKEAHGSPLLMQLFCREFSLSQKIRQRQSTPANIRMTGTYESFFQKVAERQKDRRVATLLGGRLRRDRNLRSGRTADIYEVVLLAIKLLLPARVLTHNEILKKIAQICERAPQRHEVERVLQKMSETAANDIKGLPVLYNLEDKRKVLIEDPFFAFYVKWGDWLARR